MPKVAKQQLGLLYATDIAILARKQRGQQQIFLTPYTLSAPNLHPLITALPMPQAMDQIIFLPRPLSGKALHQMITQQALFWFGLPATELNFDYQLNMHAKQAILYVCACQKAFAKKIVKDHQQKSWNPSAITTLSHALYRLLRWMYGKYTAPFGFYYSDENYSYWLVLQEQIWLQLQIIPNLKRHTPPPLQPWLEDTLAQNKLKNLQVISAAELADKIKLTPAQLPAAGAAIWNY